MENSVQIDGFKAVKRFLRDHPEREWFLILRACLAEAETRDEFAGTWVLQEAQKLGVKWFPNLRPLVVCGILQKTEISRGGRRAYYVMADPEGVKRALQEGGTL